MQIVFLDAKSAFDLTSTEATTKMMGHLGTPEDLIDKINNLATKGTFRVEMFKKSSAETKILSGTSQCCPGRVLKFGINHEGNLLIYSNMDFSWSLTRRRLSQQFLLMILVFQCNWSQWQTMKNCSGSSTHSAELLDSPSINPKPKNLLSTHPEN